MRSRKLKKILITFILLISLILLYMVTISSFIYPLDNKLQKSDAAIVMQGSIPDRILHAVDLYNENYIDKIIMVEERKINKKLLEEKGLDLKQGEELNKDIAIKLGVKKNDIIIIPGMVGNTKEEVLRIKNYMMENEDIESLILVTSKYHSGRSLKMLNRGLKPSKNGLRIISSPSKYDNYNRKKWWTDSYSKKVTILESLKFINYYLFEWYQL